MIDIKKTPDWWAVCPNEKCTVAETCLRHKVCKLLTQKYKYWLCVLPQAWENTPCAYYQKTEKVTMARGFARAFKGIGDRHVRSYLRLALTGYFGSKGSYYRYKNQERDINPKMQQEIRDIVRRYKPEADDIFDKTYEDYDFTNF